MTDVTNIARAFEPGCMLGRAVSALEQDFAAGVNGNVRAYVRALTGISGLVRRLARRQLARGLLGAADIEDVVQEVLLAVHDKRHTWDAGRPFEPWLAGILRYKLLTARRARARDRLATAALLDDLAEILPAPTEPDGAGSSDILD